MPPFSLWRNYPGFYRLEGTLKLAKRMSFTQEGFVRKLNNGEPVTKEHVARAPITAKTIAKELRTMYRDMVRRGGA